MNKIDDLWKFQKFISHIMFHSSMHSHYFMLLKFSAPVKETKFKFPTLQPGQNKCECVEGKIVQNVLSSFLG